MFGAFFPGAYFNGYFPGEGSAGAAPVAAIGNHRIALKIGLGL